MIVQLFADQIARQWDVVRHALEHSLPPIAGEGEDRMERLLEALLCGRMQCWAIYRKEEEGVVMEALMCTTPIQDTNTGGADLLIYSLYSFDFATQESWVSGLELLKNWARGQGYTRIVAYTNNVRVLEMTEKLGGVAEYTYLSFNVGG